MEIFIDKYDSKKIKIYCLEHGLNAETVKKNISKEMKKNKDKNFKIIFEEVIKVQTSIAERKNLTYNGVLIKDYLEEIGYDYDIISRKLNLERKKNPNLDLEKIFENVCIWYKKNYINKNLDEKQKIEKYCQKNNFKYNTVKLIVRKLKKENPDIEYDELMQLVHDDYKRKNIEKRNRLYKGMTSREYCEKNNFEFKSFKYILHRINKENPDLKYDEIFKLAIKKYLKNLDVTLYHGKTMKEFCLEHNILIETFRRKLKIMTNDNKDLNLDEIATLVIEDYKKNTDKEFIYYKGTTLSKYLKENGYDYSKVTALLKKNLKNNKDASVEEIIDEILKNYTDPKKIKYTYNGVSLKDVCKEKKISYSSIIHSLKTYKEDYPGKTLEEAIVILVDNQVYLKIPIHGVFLKEYCKINNLEYKSVSKYIRMMLKNNKELSNEEALEKALIKIKNISSRANSYKIINELKEDLIKSGINEKYIYNEYYKIKKKNPNISLDQAFKIAIQNYYENPPKEIIYYKGYSLNKYCNLMHFDATRFRTEFENLKNLNPNLTTDELIAIVTHYTDKIGSNFYYYDNMLLKQYCIKYDIIYDTVLRKILKIRNNNPSMIVQEIVNDVVAEQLKKGKKIKYKIDGKNIREYCNDMGYNYGIILGNIHKQKKLNPKIEVSELLEIAINKYLNAPDKIKYYYKGFILKTYCEDNELNYQAIVSRINKLRITNSKLTNEELVVLALNSEYKLVTKKIVHYYNNKPLKEYCENNDINYQTMLCKMRSIKDANNLKTDKEIIEEAIEYYKNKKNNTLMYGNQSLFDYCALNNLDYINIKKNIKKKFKEYEDIPLPVIIDIVLYKFNELKLYDTIYYKGYILEEYCQIYKLPYKNILSLYKKYKNEFKNLNEDDLIHMVLIKIKPKVYKYYYQGIPLFMYCKLFNLPYDQIITTFYREIKNNNDISKDEILENIIENYEATHKYFISRKNEKILKKICLKKNIDYEEIKKEIMFYTDKYVTSNQEDIIKIIFYKLGYITNKNDYMYESIDLKLYCKLTNHSYTFIKKELVNNNISFNDEIKIKEIINKYKKEEVIIYKNISLYKYCEYNNIHYNTIFKTLLLMREDEKYLGYSDTELIDIIINDILHLIMKKRFYVNGVCLKDYCSKISNLSYKKIFYQILEYKKNPKFSDLEEDEIVLKVIKENTTNKLNTVMKYNGINLIDYCKQNAMNYYHIRDKINNMIRIYPGGSISFHIETALINWSENNNREIFYYRKMELHLYCYERNIDYEIIYTNIIKLKEETNLTNEEIIEIIMSKIDSNGSLYGQNYSYNGMKLQDYCELNNIHYIHLRVKITRCLRKGIDLNNAIEYAIRSTNYEKNLNIQTDFIKNLKEEETYDLTEISEILKIEIDSIKTIIDLGFPVKQSALIVYHFGDSSYEYKIMNKKNLQHFKNCLEIITNKENSFTGNAYDVYALYKCDIIKNKDLLIQRLKPLAFNLVKFLIHEKNELYTKKEDMISETYLFFLIKFDEINIDYPGNFISYLTKATYWHLKYKFFYETKTSSIDNAYEDQKSRDIIDKEANQDFEKIYSLEDDFIDTIEEIKVQIKEIYNDDNLNIDLDEVELLKLKNYLAGDMIKQMTNLQNIEKIYMFLKFELQLIDDIIKRKLNLSLGEVKEVETTLFTKLKEDQNFISYVKTRFKI